MSTANLVLASGIELKFERIDGQSTFWEKAIDIFDDRVTITAHRFKGHRSTLHILSFSIFNSATRKIRVSRESWSDAERDFVKLVKAAGLVDYLGGFTFQMSPAETSKGNGR